MAENRELALVLKLVADEFQKELKNSQGALSSFNNFIKDWRTQLAAAGTALFAIAKSTANYGDELFKTSQKVGIQVQALAGLQHAAKLADVDNRQLQIGLQALSRAMVDSAQGSGEGHEAFKRIGVSAVDASGKLKPMQDVFLEIADVFNRTTDGAGKTEAAMKLMGKSGADLIPLMNGGKASIQELMAEAERLGLVMSEKDAKAAEEFNDSITRLEAQAKGFSVTIGKHMLGPLTELMSLMNDLGSGPIGSALNVFLKAVNQQIILFGTLLKEVGANFDFLRGKLNFDELSAKVKSIEADANKKLFLLEHPAAAELLDPKQKPTGRDVALGAGKSGISKGGGKTTNDHAKEQERLGVALLDIYRSQNNALEIQKNHLREELTLMFRQEEIADEEMRTRAAQQEALGKNIVVETQRQIRLRDDGQQRERDGLIQNLQAWIDYDNAVGASTELRYQHQVDLLKANLAKQVDVTTEEAGRLLEAWKNVDNVASDSILQKTTLTVQQRETIELQSLTKLQQIHEQTSSNIFEGWARGLQRYVQDTQSGFGLGADLARRTAQTMEQNFRTFFFDAFEGKIRSLKDVFQSFGNFVKQILAQVAAQLATMLVLKGITGGFGGGGGGFLSLFQGSGFGAAQTPLFGFASGGPVLGAGNQDSVRAMLTPGEGVLNRKGMQALAQLNHGEMNGPAPVNMTVNIVNSGRQDAPQINYRRQFRGMVMDIIYRDPDFRNMLAGRA